MFLNTYISLDQIALLIIIIPAYEYRKKLGRELAKKENDIDADLVVPVPDSGVPAALGYADNRCSHVGSTINTHTINYYL